MVKRGSDGEVLTASTVVACAPQLPGPIRPAASSHARPRRQSTRAPPWLCCLTNKACPRPTPTQNPPLSHGLACHSGASDAVRQHLGSLFLLSAGSRVSASARQEAQVYERHNISQPAVEECVRRPVDHPRRCRRARSRASCGVLGQLADRSSGGSRQLAHRRCSCAELVWRPCGQRESRRHADVGRRGFDPPRPTAWERPPVLTRRWAAEWAQLRAAARVAWAAEIWAEGR